MDSIADQTMATTLALLTVTAQDQVDPQDQQTAMATAWNQFLLQELKLERQLRILLSLDEKSFLFLLCFDWLKILYLV